MDNEPAPLEIERTFLLDGLPALPDHAAAHRIEQGYFSDRPGRLRRNVAPDGSVECTHTVKKGSGLVREERERIITEKEFEQGWPLTEGRRLLKTRYVIDEGDFTWEIDAYHDLNLVLAEVELTAADIEVTPPEWLAPHIVRDVTAEIEFQNYELALRLSKP